MTPAQNTNTAAREAQLLEQSCTQLEAELSRQRRILDAMKEQGRAARAQDLATLDRVTREMAVMVAEGLRADGERQALSARLAAHFNMPVADVKVSALVARVQDPWRARLVQTQRNLKEVLAVIQRLVRSNGRFLRDGARTADRILNEVFGAAPAEASAYESDGRQPDRSERVSAVLNVAG